MKIFLLLCISTSVVASFRCGIRTYNEGVNIAKRYGRSIIGGRNVTSPNRWPWQALVIERDGDGESCGGTIIGEQWILTAAHCVESNNASLVEAFTGVTQINGSEFVRVADVLIHVDYDTNNITVNDIALIKLASPLTYDTETAPICLPSPSQWIPKEGWAVATGFGVADVPGTHENVTDGQLREVAVPLVPAEVCAARWTVSGKYTIEEWSRPKLICASSEDRGTYAGDSGGPLMMKATDGRWFQIGVTAFCTNGTGYDGMRGDIFPKTFTDVRKYCGWIKDATEGEVNCQEEEVMLEYVEIQS